MDSNKKRPILYKGEVYSKPIEKRRLYIPKEPSTPYEVARENLLNNLHTINTKLKETPDSLKLPNETVICLRFEQEYAAKSYYPEALLRGNQDLHEIGSRIWRDKKKKQEELGKLFFLRTNENGLQNFESKLQKATKNLPKDFINDVRRVYSLDLLKSEERALGIDKEWESGQIEIILHPFDLDRSLTLNHFKKLALNAGINLESIRSKQYDSNGPTFISLHGNREIIKILSQYNPIRTLHPITFRELSVNFRSTPTPNAPHPPKFTKKSPTIVGVIDGGYIQGNSSLDNYVEEIDVVKGVSIPGCQSHGTLTTSAVLYGPLHKHSKTDTLPEPSVSVRNFKVFSATTPSSNDIELYSIIDAIEDIVPANNDIQVYNLSLGPKGPILDDHINRFTYACDTLSIKHNVLFCVAVGNDGEHANYDRIQSPSDMVNGMGVSAYTLIDGSPQPAPYSCKGPGREGNKMKPDMAAFGGCERFPIQLVSHNSGAREHTYGTSFSTPLVSAVAAKLIGESNGVINALTARLMLTHSASLRKDYEHCSELGHGLLPESTDYIMTCDEGSYTLIYEGEVDKGKYREFEIPWTDEIISGKATLHWTTAVQTNVDPNSPEDYTSSSVEIRFYPNSNKYIFSKDNQTKIVDIEKDSLLAQELLAEGWTQSNTPQGSSTPKPFTAESDLRKDLKWDSLDIRKTSKMVGSLRNPIFQVHAISRGKRNNSTKVKFAIALTISVSNKDIDLYQKIRAKYNVLTPINMSIQTQIQTHT